MVSHSAIKNTGLVSARLIKNVKSPGLKWKLAQYLRTNYLIGYLFAFMAVLFSKITGIQTIVGTLTAKHTDKVTGIVTNYGVVSKRVITTAWANFIVDQLQTETSEIGDLKFHESGTGTTAANIADVDIETASGEGRISGTQGEGASANIYRTVGTITYSGPKAITEHGIFTHLSAGTMCDRHVFAEINVDSTDQIEFTYELTQVTGG